MKVYLVIPDNKNVDIFVTLPEAYEFRRRMYGDGGALVQGYNFKALDDMLHDAYFHGSDVSDMGSFG